MKNKWEMLEITKTKEGFVDLVRNIQPGEQKEAIGQLLAEDYKTYVKLTMSETKVYTLEAWLVTDSGMSHTYTFKTQDSEVIEWFVQCNLIEQFDDLLPGQIGDPDHFQLDLNENKHYWTILLQGTYFCLVSKKNKLEQTARHFQIKEDR